MATFTKSLEQAISQAFKFATEKKHQYVTLEHLLLALTDETDARNVMKACNVDVDLLNENLEFYIDNELENIVTSDTKLSPNQLQVFKESFKDQLFMSSLQERMKLQEQIYWSHYLLKEKVTQHSFYKNKRLLVTM